VPGLCRWRPSGSLQRNVEARSPPGRRGLDFPYLLESQFFQFLFFGFELDQVIYIQEPSVFLLDYKIRLYIRQ